MSEEVKQQRVVDMLMNEFTYKLAYIEYKIKQPGFFDDYLKWEIEQYADRISEPTLQVDHEEAEVVRNKNGDMSVDETNEFVEFLNIARKKWL